MRASGRGVAALRLAEGGDAVADRLDAGERGAAGGEGAQQQEAEGESGEALVLGSDLQVGGGRPHGVAEDEAAEGAPGDEGEDPGHEDVGGDGEEAARLLDAAEVHEGEQHDDGDGGRRLVLHDEGDGGAEVLHAGGDGHGDGQDVVDEEGARHAEAGLRPEVGLRDLVVPAAAGVGAHVLPVRGDDGAHQDDDGGSDPRAVDVRGRAGDGQDEEDLARCVRH